MDDSFTFTNIMSKKDYINFEKMEGVKESIINLVEISDNYMIQIKNPIVNLKTLIDNGSETHNVNISIAAAVSAYARIHMSQFKNNPLLPDLYYTDTDSAYFEGPLPDYFISNTELGKMKLEKICNKGIFLAPKVYALLDENNKTDIKIKGVSKKAIIENNLNINLFESLLYKNYNIELKQNKWFKNLIDANITIKDQIYSLKVTENKRELIYDFNNRLISTNPLTINTILTTLLHS